LQDNKSYLEKKAFFDKVLTIYGRNSVVEALEDNSLQIHKLHLSTSNKKAPIIDKIVSLANKRDIPIAYHDKQTLSRISKNAKQDQGVALDIVAKKMLNQDEFLQQHQSFRVLALDGITNPQNLGMIIRSAAAGNIDAIILPDKKSSSITPLVIKASVGTLFRMPIIKTNSLYKTLQQFKEQNTSLYTLSSHAKANYKDETYPSKVVFVLGNETQGVSKEIESLCNKSIAIPMNRGVESLNVAVTASLLAFL